MEIIFLLNAIVFLGMGIFTLVSPETIIDWYSYSRDPNCEPTERNVRAVRIMGIITIVFAIIAAMAYFVS